MSSSWHGLPIDHPEAVRALADVGFGSLHDVVDVTIHDTLDVDREGRERVRTIRNVVRAVRDGAERLPALLTLDVPSGESAEFVPVSGCPLGRQVSRPEVGVFAAELILDRPLRLGETAAAEHRVLLPRDDGPQRCIEYYLLREVTELMIWVRFFPAAASRQCGGLQHLRRDPDREPGPPHGGDERAARAARGRTRRGGPAAGPGYPSGQGQGRADGPSALDEPWRADDATGCSRAAQSDFSGPNCLTRRAVRPEVAPLAERTDRGREPP